MADRLRLGVFGLTGCAGDQLVLLDCEDELLALVERFDVRDFAMAATGGDHDGPLDVALVEGVVASRRDEQTLRRIRARSGTLVALGTCAAWGGIPAADDGADRAALLGEIYGKAADAYDTLLPRALHEVVAIDHAIPGCPVEKAELLAALAALLRGDPPLPATFPVCSECSAREAPCLLGKVGPPCRGPLTAGGCGARCPALGTPCLGCRGPARDANLAGYLDACARLGIPRGEAAAGLGTFGPPRLPPGPAGRIA